MRVAIESKFTQKIESAAVALFAAATEGPVDLLCGGLEVASRGAPFLKGWVENPDTDVFVAWEGAEMMGFVVSRNSDNRSLWMLVHPDHCDEAAKVIGDALLDARGHYLYPENTPRRLIVGAKPLRESPTERAELRRIERA